MFASFILERDYPVLADLPRLFDEWLRGAGVLAMLALLAWIPIRSVLGRGNVWQNGLSGRLSHLDEPQMWKLRALRLLLILTGVSVVAFLFMMLFGSAMQGQSAVEALQGNQTTLILFRTACFLALLTLAWEFLLDLGTLSFRRLWALARFSIKEAIRRKILWSFLVLLLVFLFSSWFIQTSRSESQWNTYIGLVFFIIAALVLLTSSVVACFSLPTDIKSQTLYTVVTKPVQKFEVVLGRILGLVLLMTVVLFVAGNLSLLYVFRGLSPTAREVALRAKQPIFGNLIFQQLNESGVWVTDTKGTDLSVGREFDLRKYIRGASSQEAVWQYYRSIPRHLAQRVEVPVEFTFDIFRTSKGGTDQYREGVDVQLTFINRSKWNEARMDEYRKARDPKTGLELSPAERARVFGYYELPRPVRIVDEKNQHYQVTFPGSLLEDLGDGIFEVRVACRTSSQYLGLYKYDLYVLDDEQNFYLNYLKGLTGTWFFMVIVVTLGVVFSTYLNAPVSLMLTWMLMILGIPKLREFVKSLTQILDRTNNPGGGPLEAALRLMTRQNLVTQLERTRANEIIQGADTYFFQYVFQGLYNILPDLGQYDRAMFIAEGFNIPGGELAMSCILLALYLFPFLLAGYYLINVREVAA
jgi:ABC-type transport system involved in multi-copper enzyme maturation permease subunit